MHDVNELRKNVEKDLAEAEANKSLDDGNINFYKKMFSLIDTDADKIDADKVADEILKESQSAAMRMSRCIERQQENVMKFVAFSNKVDKLIAEGDMPKAIIAMMSRITVANSLARFEEGYLDVVEEAYDELETVLQDVEDMRNRVAAKSGNYSVEF